jgi:hypothetical protein
VYENRPFICRAYGATRGNPIECRHGCEIVGKPLSNTEVLQGLAKSYDIGGGQLRAQSAEAAELLLALIEHHPDSQRVIDLSMTPQGRLTLAREQLNRTVFSPLPRGGKA